MQPKKKTNSKMKKQPIPEDFELSDEEPTTIKLDEEQKVSSKFVTFDCPNCFIKLQLRNEIEINPKGIKCKCNPCSFKISKNDKTVNVSRDDNGDIKLDTEAHSISFSCNFCNNSNTNLIFLLHLFSLLVNSSNFSKLASLTFASSQLIYIIKLYIFKTFIKLLIHFTH